MPRIDFNAPLLNFNGDAIKESAAEDAKAILLGTICKGALMRDEEGLTLQDKCDRWALAGEISRKGVVDLKSEDVSMLKTCLSFYPTQIVGAAVNLLDPPAVNAQGGQE